jgi:hypothetical protein
MRQMPIAINVVLVFACLCVAALTADVTPDTDPRVTRIVERAVDHERWCRQSVRRGLMTREDFEIDPDAASLLDEREGECE